MTEVDQRLARSGEQATPGARTRARILVRADSQARSLGEGVVDRRDPRLWSSVLESRLRASGLCADVENAGVAGLRIGDAWRGYALDHLVRDRFDTVDTVVLAVGVNDWWPLARPRSVAGAMERIRPLPLRAGLHRAYQRARPALVRWSNGRFRPTRPEHARRDLERLVAALQATHRVALVTPLPVSSPRNPGFDGNTVEAAAAVAAVARARGVPVVDTHELFAPVEWDEVSADHVHVNPSGHAVIALAVADALDPEQTGRGGPDTRDGERGPRPDTGSAQVVVRFDLDGFGLPPGQDDRRTARQFAAALQRRLRADGRPDASVRDGCFRGLDIAYLHRSLLHDPLVREPISASAFTVLGVTPGGRVTPHVGEAYRWLVSVTREVTRPVLVVPPRQDGRPGTHRRFAALVTGVGHALHVPVVDLSDLDGAGRGPLLDAVAARLAAVIATRLDGTADGPLRGHGA
jgi:lysophospholipase L1-like esterase